MRFTTNGKNTYMLVQFEKRKNTITQFSYPDSLNNFIFLDQPELLATKEKFMNSEYGKIQFNEELNHFISISKKC